MANYSKISLKDGKLLLEGTEGNSPWQSSYNVNSSFGLSGIEQVNGGVLAYGNRGSDGKRQEKFYSNFNLNDSNSINNLLAQNFNYTPSVNNNNQVSSNNQNNSSPNLNTTINNTSSPNIIDSSSGNAYIKNTANEITRLEQEQKDWDELQKKQLNQNIADVEADYLAREEKAKQSYKEMGGTQDVTQFRLGQSGTPYQAAEKAKLEKDKLNYFNALSNEKASKIAQLKSAYETNNFKAVSELRNSIAKLKKEQETFLQTERKNQLEAAQNAIKAAREDAKYQQEKEDRYIKNLIPQIYGNLTGDNETDLQTINDFSTQYGIDKNMIMSNLISYKTAQDKENLLNSSSVASILSKTKNGGSVNIPGLGSVDILGQAEDKAPTTLKAGGKIYNWVGGKWTDTGIKDSDFTPSNIIDALTKIGDTDALSAYLQGQGIFTSEFTSGEGMRTDRHNNPTAMTTDVAKNGGLIEGVDYVKGDPFTTESGKTLYTAKLLGDPIDTTIKAIDNMSFTTGSGKNRWNYTDQIPGANNEEWPNLSYEQKANVIKEMYKREGGNGSIFGQQTGDKFDTFTQEQIALSVLPVQTRNSEIELKRALEGIRAGLKQGLSPYEIADNLMGYKVNNPDNFSNTIRGFISQSEKLDGTAPAEFARMINAGNYSGVVTKLENTVLKGTGGKEKEALAIYSSNYGDRAYNLIQENINKLGIIKGNWNDKVRKKVVKTEEFQKLSSSLAGLVSEWRHEMIGSAATENELKMIEDLIPKVTDNPWNALEKIKELQYMNLASVNSIRESENLPSLTKETLIDRNKRVGLYGGKTPVNLSVAFNGKTYTFKDEDSLNKFKSQFNIQ